MRLFNVPWLYRTGKDCPAEGGLSLLLKCLCFQVFGKNDVWFWVIFSMIHVLASLALSTQIYYMGRFKIGECCVRTISSQVCRCLLSPPACAAQSYGPSSDLPCPLIPLMLSWPLKSLCCCFPEQWESAGAVCSVVQDCWALGELPFSCSSPWCCAQRGHLHPVRGEGLLGSLLWLLCSAYKPISSSSSASVCLRWP